MGNSSKVMGKIAQLTNITEINQIATSLQTNLTKMGVVGEMVEDAMDDMNEDIVGDDAVSSSKRRMLRSCSMTSRTRSIQRRSKPRVDSCRWKRRTILTTC